MGYYKGTKEIRLGEEPHDFCNAVSPGLKVVVQGEDGRVSQKRQNKPLLHAGHHRSMLVASLNGVYVHILGELVIITDHKLMIGDIVKGARRQ